MTEALSVPYFFLGADAELELDPPVLKLGLAHSLFLKQSWAVVHTSWATTVAARCSLGQDGRGRGGVRQAALPFRHHSGALTQPCPPSWVARHPAAGLQPGTQILGRAADASGGRGRGSAAGG